MWLGIYYSFSISFHTFSVLAVSWYGELIFWSCLFGVLYASWTSISISFLRFGKFFFYGILRIFSVTLPSISSPSVSIMHKFSLSNNALHCACVQFMSVLDLWFSLNIWSNFLTLSSSHDILFPSNSFCWWDFALSFLLLSLLNNLISCFILVWVPYRISVSVLNFIFISWIVILISFNCLCFLSLHYGISSYPVWVPWTYF